MKDMVRNLALAAVLGGLLSLGAAAQSSGIAADRSNATTQEDANVPGAHSQQKSSASQTSSAPGSGSASSTGQLSRSDAHFVKKAAEGGLAEVQLGELAQQKASSNDVKQFAKRMVDDHSKANHQLQQLASSKGVALPASLSAKDQALKEKLSDLNGAQFDRAYMRDMVNDHAEDVAEFERESNDAKDSSVKDFVSQTLPTLQSHLQEAKSIDSKVSSSGQQSSRMQAQNRQH
jgi:putative membrane protein